MKRTSYDAVFARIVLMDKELREKLYGLNWESILTELYAYAYARFAYPGMSHSAPPKDLVNDAVSRVLSGEWTWDYEKYPDITIYLKTVIKGLANRAWKKEKTVRKRDEALTQLQDCNPAQSQVDQLDTEAFHKSLLDKIEADLADEDELLLMYYAMKEGHLKDQELAEELGLEIKAVRNAKKRMRRKLTDVKQRLGKL